MEKRCVRFGNLNAKSTALMVLSKELFGVDFESIFSEDDSSEIEYLPSIKVATDSTNIFTLTSFSLKSTINVFSEKLISQF